MFAEENKMTQDEINRSEWANAQNWSSGPKWLCVYFSHKDSRTWVPKRIPWMGGTLNLAKANGVAWLVGFLVGIPLLIILIILATE